jgi:hypothetical protein
VKKVIFLDLDGVMVPFWNLPSNDYASPKDNMWNADPFSKLAVKHLNHILKETDAEIVISSDWRNYYSLSQLQDIFEFNGVDKVPIDVTTNSKLYTAMDLEGGRITEIMRYVKKHNLKYWVSIDDLDMFSLGPHFVHCNRPSSEGLKQTGLRDKVIKALNIEYDNTTIK